MQRALRSGAIRKSLLRGMPLVLAAFLCARAEGPAVLPDFTLPDLDGKQWKSSDFRGKPVVIDFWATWCASCRQSVPKLAELSGKYKERGLVVIGISIDKSAEAKIRKGAKKFGITYLILHDAESGMAKAFGFSAIPSVFVFDRTGKLKKGMPAYDPDQESQLIQAVEQAL
jgi:peroxiredoxin